MPKHSKWRNRAIVHALVTMMNIHADPLQIAASAGARLSTPEKAIISRKRKVQTNPEEKKSNVRGSVDPNESSWDRVKEFKDQCLTVVSGNLRCDACKETISKKKSSVKKHVASAKHIKAHIKEQKERMRYYWVKRNSGLLF